MKLRLYAPCSHEDRDGLIWPLGEGKSEPGVPYRERWIEVTAQAAPAHIGHPSEYPDGDPYSDFLPPVVEYDPKNWSAAWQPRAVVIVDEDHLEKDGQRYTEPLLVLTGKEYEEAAFPELLARIQHAAETRFGGWPPLEAEGGGV
jgi:hypothetical protein